MGSPIEMLSGLDAFIGADSGVLKGLNLTKSTFANFRPSILAEGIAAEDAHVDATTSTNSGLAPITAMDFAHKDQTEVLIGRKNGKIDLFNVLTEKVNTLFILPEASFIQGIHPIKDDRILTASASGNLGIWDAFGRRISKEEWSAGDNLLTMRVLPGESAADVFATGGRENPLKLWDLGQEKCIFTAKNVRPDSLELRVPVWVTNCQFIDESGKCLVTSTGNAKIRLYDVRTQRRPVLQESWLDEPIQALSICCRDLHVLAGNNRGELGLFDMRSTCKSRLVSKYKGFAGSIRSIDASKSQPQILSCGIDRFAILHNLDSRETIRKIYCKVQLNCCLLSDGNSFLSNSPPSSYARKRVCE